MDRRRPGLRINTQQQNRLQTHGQPCSSLPHAGPQAEGSSPSGSGGAGAINNRLQWPAGGGPLGTGSLHCRLPHADAGIHQHPAVEVVEGGSRTRCSASKHHRWILSGSVRRHSPPDAGHASTRSPLPSTSREEHESWVVRALGSFRTPSEDPKVDPSRQDSHASPWNRMQDILQGSQGRRKDHHQFDAHTHSMLCQHAQQRSVPE